MITSIAYYNLISPSDRQGCQPWLATRAADVSRLTWRDAPAPAHAPATAARHYYVFVSGSLADYALCPV